MHKQLHYGILMGLRLQFTKSLISTFIPIFISIIRYPILPCFVPSSQTLPHGDRAYYPILHSSTENPRILLLPLR